MAKFTLRVFEQVGGSRSSTLRPLGSRETTGVSPAEGKRWLSEMMEAGRLDPDRFYLFEAGEDGSEGDMRFSIAFFLFSNARLCPLRIWRNAETASVVAEIEWTADFEGVPGWTRIAALEPRWYCERTVPVEQSWMGRSNRDWQKRDCWVLTRGASAKSQSAA